VCEAAGYTRGAFYSNFQSLDELFYALYQERTELIIANLGASLAGPADDVSTRIGRVIDTLQISREWALVRGDFLLHAARRPVVAKRLREYRHELRAALAEKLATGLNLKALPPALSSAEQVAEAAMTIYDGASERLLLGADPAELRSWLTEILTMLLSSR
ncbi:MAG TPA: TetR/AcrR family transcriptional regulator, partial [Solirubrobacteraceae bacterium]|nr:TetR/AcrR family transcriptional regulator [Solirubrobacteraceae bacterium]